MPILNKNDINEVRKYNEYIQGYKNSNIMQSLEWGKVKQGWKQEVVYVEENDTIIASVMVLLKPLPILKSHFMYAPRGPVCNIEDINIMRKLLEELKLIIKKYKVFAFRFDPAIKYNDKIKEMATELGIYIRPTTDYKLDMIQPRYNMILELTDKTEEELLKEFSEKTRYNIRLATKKDVKVRYSHDEKDLKIFYDIHKVTGNRDEFAIRGYDYFKRMLDIFDLDTMRIYITSHEDEPLSAALCFNYNGEVWYMYGASSNSKRNLMPNYLMQWEMIKWAIETKANLYNFGGIIKMDKENDGVYKFKAGFCKKEGVTEYIGELDKVYRKFDYILFDKIFPKIRRIKSNMSKSKNK